eukprot:CAMPEP_0198199410 /NCGR_PEP_ID=MMETSP1445-20131203/2719_1 /TAXON_ID=36898 /ORGANISM="Pyramimonas sp., Strain CCMP2087" /LENGTH=122 /DNA_ID=CAMNT_0043869249 /DNA_START=251 /DNA_END=617 /DNA_ORIENTATION=-
MSPFTNLSLYLSSAAAAASAVTTAVTILHKLEFNGGEGAAAGGPEGAPSPGLVFGREARDAVGGVGGRAWRACEHAHVRLHVLRPDVHLGLASLGLRELHARRISKGARVPFASLHRVRARA